MPKRAVDSWGQQQRLRLQQREREMEEFVKGWDWERVYRALARRIKDFNVALNPLFLTIGVHDPKHASTLLSFRPVVVEFVAAPHRCVAKALEEEGAAQQRRAAESAAAWKTHKQAEKERLEALRVQHPRWGEFQGPSDEELKRLVWAKPLTQLAEEFGVSDVAIGKRCRVRGIARPPRGHWLTRRIGGILVGHLAISALRHASIHAGCSRTLGRHPPRTPRKGFRINAKSPRGPSLLGFLLATACRRRTLFGRRGLLAAVASFGFARRRVFRQARLRVGLPFRRRRVPETSDPFSASQPSPTRAGQVVRVGL
jgi:hypothetical protein